MGACFSRQLVASAEDVLFSLGSLYSFLVSHVSAFLNRFYSLLLSPLFRDHEEQIPSTLCDGDTGVCIRPKERVKQSRKKVEMRMRRAELAAKGLDPNLALKRRDSRASNADTGVVAGTEKIMKRWSRADSVAAVESANAKEEKTGAMPATAPNTQRLHLSRESAELLRSKAGQTEGRRSMDAALKAPMRSRTAPMPGVGSRPPPARSTPARAAPPAAVALEHAFSPQAPPQETAKLKSRQRLSLTAEADQLDLRRNIKPRPRSYAAPATSGTSRASPSPLVAAAPTPYSAAAVAAASSAPSSPPAPTRTRVSTNMSSNDATSRADGTVQAAAERLAIARQSIDHQRSAVPESLPVSRTTTRIVADPISRTSTPPLASGSQEPSPRGSVSDLAAAACNARCAKKERKLWRDEVERAAQRRVRAA